MSAWHLITGEYPPGCGGVGDYTALVAAGLASRGVETHVWAPVQAGAAGEVTVHATGFGRAGLAALGQGLDARPGPRTLLVQYAPQAFGFRGANLGFCRWVLARARAGDEVRVMFHEPWVPAAPRPRRLALAGATRWMARLLLAAARRVYVSVPAWNGLLRPWAPGRRLAATWLPIPSTVPVGVAPDRVAALREAVGAGRPVLGHFGTYGRQVGTLLEPALAEALHRSDAVALLVGRGADGFTRALLERRPELRGRLTARDGSSPGELSIELQAMDVALQPYLDGATARRTTLMAALAHGVAVAGHRGRYSEAVWSDAGLGFAPDAASVGARAAALLRDPAERARVAAAGAELYERRFALRHTLDTLLEAAP